MPLPDDLEDPRGEARTTFDAVAGLYDRARPGYPREALVELASRCGLGPGSRVLEVGCGTGQATRDLARTGASIECLEPGHALAELARTNLAELRNVRVRAQVFETLAEQPGCYEAVVSATAFHWIDPHVSFTKTAELLVPDGSLALVTNAHAAGGTHTDERIAEPIRELHRRLAPEIGAWTFPTLEEIRTRAMSGGDIAAVWSRVERKLSDPPPVAHLFEPPLVSVYPWTVTYDRDGYLAMLASQSSYALLDPQRRADLLVGIGQLLDEHLGGTITKQYVTILATARRHPSASATSARC